MNGKLLLFSGHQPVQDMFPLPSKSKSSHKDNPPAGDHPTSSSTTHPLDDLLDLAARSLRLPRVDLEEEVSAFEKAFAKIQIAPASEMKGKLNHTPAKGKPPPRGRTQTKTKRPITSRSQSRNSTTPTESTVSIDSMDESM